MARTATILLEEDEDILRTVVTKVLERNGFHVLGATSVGEAIEILRSGARVDLAIADVGIPGRNDLAQLRELWRLGADLPLIYVSGYPQEHAERSFPLRSGARFLEKPFRCEELLTEIRELLEPQA